MREQIQVGPNQNLQAICDEIEKINRSVKNLGQKAIKFREFAFSGKPNADAWCETWIPDAKRGLILDFTSLLENLNNRIS